MFRILIVEDIVEMLSQLAELLSETFSEHDTKPKIDTAQNVREARSLIEAAYLNKKPYHAVLLDFNLPMDIGYSTEIDESLCLTVRDLMPAALVVHLSAYLDDQKIERHLRRFHLETLDRSFTLSKMDSDSPLQLVCKLKAFLYGAQIEEQIDRLFGSTYGSDLKGRNTQSSLTDGRMTTHQLAALCRDIVRHWRDLDGPVKERIERLFYVDSSTDPIRISLF